ncbi:MAG: ABC transporter ATP-binding protein [Pseudomonadota bacterium]
MVAPQPAERPAARFEPWIDPSEKPFIEIKHVTKTFGDFYAVDDVSLDIYRGEFFSLLGGSGCGKTTLLRLIAGFERLTEGQIVIDGDDLADMPPHRRPVNMMFQSYALFPHMSVARNVGFGLRQEGLASSEIKRRVGEALELVKLGPLARRKPHQLSGGQRQRVALARCLVKRPKVLLLDEPLAALDRKLREETQFELVNIQEELNLTFVVVTHDQGEAMAMSTRVGVMDAGRIVQVGTPNEVYEYPNSRFVAGFVGSVNMFDGVLVESEADHALVEGANDQVRFYVDHGVAAPTAAPVAVAIRPEKMTLSKELPDGLAEGAPNLLKGKVDEIAYLGGQSIYIVELASGQMVRVSVPNTHRMTELPITWEDQVFITWPAFAAVVLTD